MAALIWDQTGQRFFEAGVKKVALFKMENGVYQPGVAWSGVSKITESPDGADAQEIWADDIKYAAYRAAEKFNGGIEAYTYPDEWAECDGSAILEGFMAVGQQTRKPFGLAYVTTVGSDTEGFEAGYKLHLIYNATVSPSSRDYETMNDSPDAISFSWDFETTPINFEGHKATSHLEFDSVKAAAIGRTADLEALLAIVYGSANTNSRLPLPDEIYNMLHNDVETYSVNLRTMGGVLAAGKDIKYYITGTAVTLPTSSDITKEDATFGGWYDPADPTTTVTTIGSSETGDKEFIAKWSST